MAGSRAATACLLALFGLTCLALVVESRYVIVGKQQNPIEPWTEQGVNYTQWQIDNPLYVGDICVFKYRPYYHVVQQLPDITTWASCDYTDAILIGNDTAGTGPGYWVTVTDTPLFLGCGVFGHCELGQKVILNGTLGPLPANLQNAPCPSNLCAPPPGGAVASPPPASASPPPSTNPPPDTKATPSPPATISLGSPPPSTSAPTPSPPPASGGAAALAPGLLLAVLAAASALLL